ncbi:transcriptional regulator [Corallococcus praedator]|uniref:Transcriptional regulator n=1 Tax=Corallococcus praedator TaxID=2316724 RepID=A0ABX9QN24_9BACT|nr:MULTISPECIES: HipA domain-containing protein [Corallococcus]RKH31540.1 transcriptional regulator [Corallococcus sp. CA031C]RKI11165.1 transcriptional regulator [Corallococcus praedator]
MPLEKFEKHFGASPPALWRQFKDGLKTLGEQSQRIEEAPKAEPLRSRSLPNLGSSIPLYSVNDAGDFWQAATLHLLATGGCSLEFRLGGEEAFDGLPPFLEEMRPQGYMGRSFRERHPDLGLPPRTEDWSNDHVIIALARRGEDCVGNLILGQESLSRHLGQVLNEMIHGSAEVSRDSYPKRVHTFLAEGSGSSAAGEQPKFVIRGGGRHLLVKFADASSGSAGQRWRDLLACEALALEAVRAAGFDAAQAWWFDLGTYRFLEVERFDRVGVGGRRAMMSLRVIDNEYVGSGGNWTDVALRLLADQRLSPEDTRRVRWLDTFGQLIGNTDRHLGNVSFFSGIEERMFQLAPIYDMLPMVFAPDGAHLVERAFRPAPPNANNLDVWSDAARHARAYWDTLIASTDLSEDFRQRCVTCRDQLAELIARVPVS